MRNRSWLRAALPPVLALAAAAVIAAAPLRSAQAGSQERTLYVSALDGSGVPVGGLGVDAFVVRENGVRREILRVSRAVEPLDVTVLIDNSTAAGDDITFFRKAVPAFISQLTPEHAVALVGLANRPTILVPSTTDEKRLTNRAGGLFAVPNSGMTLLDGVVEVSEGLLKRDAPRAAIVAIVTDGPEFTNRYAKDVVDAVRKAQAAMHLITIGRFFDNTQHEIRERSFFINDAPRATGGSHVSMLVANGLGPHLNRVAQELTSQYKVVYSRPESLIPPDSVEVTSAREGLTVRGTPERSRKGA